MYKLWQYYTEHSILGPAIDEAAEYYNLQQWIGISASPSVHKILDKIDLSKLLLGGNSIYVKYDIPLKTSIEKNGWAINWSAYDTIMLKTSAIAKIVKNHLENARTIPIIFKWRNTLDFLTFCRK